MYLKQARLDAGHANRDTASTLVPYSPEQIGRHERGEITLTPDDALIYAAYYQRPDILLRHCADCPIGRTRGQKATDRDLPIATLRLTNRLRQAAKEIAETLENIADDGIVDAEERPIFDKAIATLQGLGETIQDLVLYAATHGLINKKGCPASAKATP